MKILHTSDWNLGKKFFNRDRFTEQKAVLSEIINIAGDRKVDIILISGNIFDGFNPSARNVELFCETVSKLAAGGKRAVVIVSGKNDCPARLKSISHLADKQGITIVSAPEDTVFKTNPAFRVSVAEAGTGYAEITVGKERVFVFLAPYCGADKGGAVIAAAPENAPPLKIALLGIAQSDISQEQKRLLDGCVYSAFGGDGTVIDAENALFASGGITDSNFDEKNRNVVVAEITEDGLTAFDAVPLTHARKLKNIIAADFDAAKPYLNEFKDRYTRLIISSDKPVSQSAVTALRKEFPLLTDILFSGFKEDFEPPKFISPTGTDVFLSFLNGAGIDDLTGFGKIFRAIMEEQNETAEA
ncbi:MAG: exonuclease subunit SbcD [Clostridiales bacterium]|jgi:hypothetical protein|nr:exonuclease subunit SbcD [Clostridiales bacterium]